MEHHADVRAQFVDVGFRIKHVRAFDENMAFVRDFKPIQAADERAFAGAGRPDHDNHFAGINMRGDILQRPHVMRKMERFGNMLHVNHEDILLSKYCTAIESVKVSSR